MKLQGLVRTTVAALLLTSTALAQSTPIPDPGTHLFESEFDGVHNEVYNTDSVRALNDSWSGQRNTAGAHGGTQPFSNSGSGLFSYRGGQGNFSDDLRIWRPTGAIPAEWVLQVRFRRDHAHCTARAAFVFLIADKTVFAGSGSAQDAGFTPGATAPFPLSTGVFYVYELVNTATQIEVRVWQSGQPRPASPLVTDVPAAAPVTEVRFVGGNFCAPGTTLDWIFVDEYTPPVPEVLFDLELAGIFVPGSRCIHLVTNDCGAASDVSLSFVDHDGDDANMNGVVDSTEGTTNLPATPVRATDSIPLACGMTPTSLCAKDRQHTLWASSLLVPNGLDFEPAGVLSLAGGDTDDDGDCDIHDVTQLLGQFGQVALPGGCPWNLDRDADFDGNGLVGAEDYAFLASAWLAGTTCSSLPLDGSGPTAVGASPHVAVNVDFNRDGTIDYRDVRIFELRYGLPYALSTKMELSERRKR